MKIHDVRWLYFTSILAAICLFFLLTYLSVMNYLSYPVATSITFQHGTLPFPTVTLCNLNGFRQSSMKEMDSLAPLIAASLENMYNTSFPEDLPPPIASSGDCSTVTCRPTGNGDIVGHSMQETVLSDFSACCNLCKSTKNCIAYSWELATSMCRLKDTSVRTRQTPVPGFKWGRVQGTKYCHNWCQSTVSAERDAPKGWCDQPGDKFIAADISNDGVCDQMCQRSGESVIYYRYGVVNGSYLMSPAGIDGLQRNDFCSSPENEIYRNDIIYELWEEVVCLPKIAEKFPIQTFWRLGSGKSGMTGNLAINVQKCEYENILFCDKEAAMASAGYSFNSDYGVVCFDPNCPDGFRGTQCKEDVDECLCNQTICGDDPSKLFCFNRYGSYACVEREVVNMFAEDLKDENGEVQLDVVLKKQQEMSVFVVCGKMNYNQEAMRKSYTNLIQHCMFDDRTCTDSDASFSVSASNGACYSFNGKNTTEHSSKRSGADSGLQLWVFFEQESLLPTSETAAFTLSIDDKLYPLYVDEKKITITAGEEVSVAMERVVKNKLPHPYGTCVDSVSEDNYFFDDSDYTQMGCYVSCIQARVIKQCGCWHPGYSEPKRNVGNCCDTEKKVCADNVTSAVTDLLSQCGLCKESCRTIEYTTSVSKLKWPTKDYVYSECYGDATCIGSFHRQHAKINIYFSKLAQRTFTEEATFPFVQIISDIGGNSGLFLGLSLLSFIAMVVDIFKR